MYYGCMAAEGTYEQTRLCQGVPVLALDDPIRYLFETLDGTWYTENLPSKKGIGMKMADFIR